MKIKPGQYVLDDFSLRKHKDFFDFLFVARKSIKIAFEEWSKPTMEYTMQCRVSSEIKAEMINVIANDALNSVRYLSFLNYSLNKYEKVYFVENDLWKIAKEISAEKLPLESIKLPMPCTVLYFKNPIRVNKQEISIVLIVDLDRAIPEEIETIAKRAIGKEMYNKHYVTGERKGNGRLICSFGIEGNDFFKAPSLNWTDVFFEDGTVGSALDKAHENAMKIGMISEEDSLGQRNFYAQLMSYIAMTMAYEDVEWKVMPEKMRKKYCPNPKDKKEIDFMSGVWIGKKRPRVKYENHNTGKKLKSHWRSAHWKMQPYGINRSKRKMIWIDEYLTGKNDEEN